MHYKGEEHNINHGDNNSNINVKEEEDRCREYRHEPNEEEEYEEVYSRKERYDNSDFDKEYSTNCNDEGKATEKEATKYPSRLY